MNDLLHGLAAIPFFVYCVCTLAGITAGQNQKPIKSTKVKRISLEGAAATPRGTSAAVWAGDTLYVSGWLDPDRKAHPTTEAQTISLL